MGSWGSHCYACFSAASSTERRGCTSRLIRSPPDLSFGGFLWPLWSSSHVVPTKDSESLSCSQAQGDRVGGQRGVGLRLAAGGGGGHSPWLLVAVPAAAFALMQSREAVSGPCCAPGNQVTFQDTALLEHWMLRWQIL